jgi:hypothetical protein
MRLFRSRQISHVASKAGAAPGVFPGIQVNTNVFPTQSKIAMILAK